MKLQNKLTSVIKSIGNIDHEVYPLLCIISNLFCLCVCFQSVLLSLTGNSSYRSFYNEHTTKIAEGFIDGDLVEQFLDLAPSDMADICKGIKVSTLIPHKYTYSAVRYPSYVEWSLLNLINQCTMSTTVIDGECTGS